MLTYVQAIVVGIIQGVSELFPVSSLGHSVLLPALFGWHNLVTDQSQGESFYLAFVVGLHVATALALIAFFWRDWVRIIGGFFVTLRTRRIETPDQRMAWMLILATIPVGIAGVLFEHQFRTLFAKPEAAAVFLTINGFILVGAELLKRRTRSTTLDSRDSSPAPAGSGGAKYCCRVGRCNRRGHNGKQRNRSNRSTGRHRSIGRHGHGLVDRDGIEVGRAGTERGHAQVPGGGRDRERPDPGSVRRDQPFGRDHGCRSGPRPQPRGQRPGSPSSWPPQ